MGWQDNDPIVSDAPAQATAAPPWERDPVAAAPWEASDPIVAPAAAQAPAPWEASDPIIAPAPQTPAPAAPPDPFLEAAADAPREYKPSAVAIPSVPDAPNVAPVPTTAQPLQPPTPVANITPAGGGVMSDVFYDDSGKPLFAGLPPKVDGAGTLETLKNQPAKIGAAFLRTGANAIDWLGPQIDRGLEAIDSRLGTDLAMPGRGDASDVARSTARNMTEGMRPPDPRSLGANLVDAGGNVISSVAPPLVVGALSENPVAAMAGMSGLQGGSDVYGNVYDQQRAKLGDEAARELATQAANRAAPVHTAVGAAFAGAPAANTFTGKLGEEGLKGLGFGVTGAGTTQAFTYGGTGQAPDLKELAASGGMGAVTNVALELLMGALTRGKAHISRRVADALTQQVRQATTPEEAQHAVQQAETLAAAGEPGTAPREPMPASPPPVEPPQAPEAKAPAAFGQDDPIIAPAPPATPEAQAKEPASAQAQPEPAAGAVRPENRVESEAQAQPPPQAQSQPPLPDAPAEGQGNTPPEVPVAASPQPTAETTEGATAEATQPENETSPAPRAKSAPLPLPPLHEDVSPANVQRAWDMISARYPRIAATVKRIEPLDTYKYGFDKNASLSPNGILRVNLDQELKPSTLAHEFTHAAQVARGQQTNPAEFNTEDEFRQKVEAPAYERGKQFEQYDRFTPEEVHNALVEQGDTHEQAADTVAKLENQRAATQGPEQGRVEPEHSGTSEVGTPTEAGGGDRVPRSEEVPVREEGTPAHAPESLAAMKPRDLTDLAKSMGVTPGKKSAMVEGILKTQGSSDAQPTTPTETESARRVAQTDTGTGTDLQSLSDDQLAKRIRDLETRGGKGSFVDVQAARQERERRAAVAAQEQRAADDTDRRSKMVPVQTENVRSLGDTMMWAEPGKEKQADSVAAQMKKIADQKYRPPRYDKERTKTTKGGPTIPKQAGSAADLLDAVGEAAGPERGPKFDFYDAVHVDDDGKRAIASDKGMAFVLEARSKIADEGSRTTSGEDAAQGETAPQYARNAALQREFVNSMKMKMAATDAVATHDPEELLRKVRQANVVAGDGSVVLGVSARGKNGMGLAADHPETGTAEVGWRDDTQPFAVVNGPRLEEAVRYFLRVNGKDSRVEFRVTQGKQSPVIEMRGAGRMGEARAYLAAQTPEKAGQAEAAAPPVEAASSDSPHPQHDTIERIVSAAAGEPNEIVPKIQLRGDDGKWYGATGFPSGVKSTGETRTSGYVLRNRDGTTGGVVEPTEEAARQARDTRIANKSEKFRQQLREMTPEQIQSQAEYWLKQRPADRAPKAAPEKLAKPANPELTGDAAIRQQLKELKAKRFKTAGDETSIFLREGELKADPAKWSAGDGVAYYAGPASKGRRGSQINRGFRVVSVDPETKQATIRQVADTGLTSSGGNNDRVGEQVVHVADLVRDKKYDAATPVPAAEPSTEPPAASGDIPDRAGLKAMGAKELVDLAAANDIKKTARSTMEEMLTSLRTARMKKAGSEPAAESTPTLPDHVDPSDLARLDERIAAKQRVMDRTEPIWNKPNETPGPMATGRDKYSMGKRLDAENNRKADAYREYQAAKTDHDRLTSIREGYIAGRVHPNGQPRVPGAVEAREAATERTRQKNEAQGFDVRKISNDLHMDGKSTLPDGRVVSYEATYVTDPNGGYRYKVETPGNDEPIYGKVHPSLAKMQGSGELRKLLGGGSGDILAYGGPAKEQEQLAESLGVAPRSTGPAKDVKGFVRSDVVPSAIETAKTLYSATDGIRKIFAPQTRSEQARQAAGMLREHGAELAQRMDRAEASLRDARKYFTKQSADKNYDFIDKMETGGDQGSGPLNAFAKQIREMLDDRREQVQELGKGKLTHFIKDYFPHIWKDPEKAAGIIGQIMGKRPIEGSKSFLKQRSIPTTKEGIAAGLEPISDNPVDLALLKIREMDRYVMGQRVLQEAKSAGLAKYKPAMEQMPDGYAKVNDKIATVYGPPTVKVEEHVDRAIDDALNEVMDNLGISHERVIKARSEGSKRGYNLPLGTLGFSEQGKGSIVSQFATEASVKAHEIGHQIDAKYDLDKIVGKHVRELDALSELRFTNHDPDSITEKEREYNLDPAEQAAQVVEAYVHAPGRMKEVAPSVYADFDKFVDAHPELSPLKTQSSLSLKKIENEQPHGGLLTMGEYVFPEPVATVFNNYLSPGLRSSPSFGGVFRAYNGAGNVLNQAQLGFSAFHAGFTSLDAAVSKLALGMERGDQAVRAALRGEGGAAIHHAAEAGKAMVTTPVALVTNAIQGDKFIREWMKPGSTRDPEFAQLVDAMKAGGTRVRLDGFYKTDHYTKMMDAFRRANIVGGLLRAPLAALEKAASPVIEWLVPRQKLGVATDMARLELEKLGPNPTRDELRAAMGKVQDSVDNRMGQLVYDNLFWNKAVKDLSMASVRSLGWNLGTIREMGGGVFPDAAKFAADAVRGRAPQFTHRMAYVASATILSGLVGAAMNKMFTGENPKELRDYFFPRTGRTDSEGRPIRLSLPSYIKDVFHYTQGAGRTVINKLHPLIGVIADMFSNEDYYGTKIRNEDDPLVKQALDLAKFAGKSFEPFGVRGLQKMNEDETTPTVEKALPFIGVTPAPRDISLSGAEKMAEDLARQELPRGARTREQADKAELKSRLTKDMKSRKPDASAAVTQAVRQHKITEEDAGEIRENARLPNLERHLKHLDPSDAIRVYEVSTPAEKKRIRRIVRDKIENAKSITEDVRRALLKRAA